MLHPNVMAHIDGAICSSFAWKDLNASALRVLIGFLRRVKKRKNPRYKRRRKGPQYIVENDSKLVYTYEDIRTECGIKSTSTVTKCIDALVDHGFIDIVRTGTGKYKLVTIYGISDRYLKWHPDPERRKKNGFREQSRQRRRTDHPGFRSKQDNGSALSGLRIGVA